MTIVDYLFCNFQNNSFHFLIFFVIFKIIAFIFLISDTSNTFFYLMFISKLFYLIIIRKLFLACQLFSKHVFF